MCIYHITKGFQKEGMQVKNNDYLPLKGDFFLGVCLLVGIDELLEDWLVTKSDMLVRKEG